jgi:hypothetical protein
MIEAEDRQLTSALLGLSVVAPSDPMDRIAARWSEMKRRLLDGEGVDVDRVESMVRAGTNYVGDQVNRVVCMPTCNRRRAVVGGHRRSSRSLADAAAEGFPPCPDCRPMGDSR